MPAVRRLLIDLTPLRTSLAFRRLWVGTTLSAVGSALTMFALPLQVYEMTHSSLAVGIVGAAQLVPMVSIGLLGGALADRLDRRRLAVRTTFGLIAVSAALAVLAHAGSGELWLIYLLAAVQGGLSAITGPVKRTFVTALLDAEQLTAGLALQRLASQVMLTTGPALAGVITAVPALGLRGCYAIDAVTYVASLYGILGVRELSGSASAVPRRTLGAIREGLRYIRTSPPLAGAVLADLSATVFALPVSLFPAINASRFGGDPRTLGLFMTAIGAGGLLGALCSGPFVHLRRQGLAMLIAVAVWGAGFAAFAIMPSLALTLLMLALAGAADNITVVMRGVIVQRCTPDELRGRVTAVDFIVGVSGGQLGNLEAGALSAITSPIVSAVAGGLATIAAAGLVGLSLPAFRRVEAVTGPAPGTAPAHA